jgi:hypothetical protein
MTLPEQSTPKRKLKVWHIVVIVLAVLYGIGQSSGKDSSPTSSSSSSSSSTSWVPSGFTAWNADVAYKWVDNPKCDDGSVCAAIQVKANKDCPNNLYAELLLQDKKYVQYDYTNDSQGSLMQGNTAELTFNFPPDGKFAHFELSKISCL